MNDTKAVAADNSDRFDRAEALLSRYPDIDGEELKSLKQWFDKEASSFEVASLATKELSGYSQFRADHMDRFSALEMITIGLIVIAVGATVLLFL